MALREIIRNVVKFYTKQCHGSDSGKMLQIELILSIGADSWQVIKESVDYTLISIVQRAEFD